MTKSLKLAGGIALALSLLSQPLIAQTRPAAAPAAAPAAPRAAIVPGVGVADLQAVVFGSNAYRDAMQNRAVQYKQVIDAAQARARQIDAELNRLITQFNADRTAKKPEATLQAEVNQIQKVRALGEEEIKRMMAPVDLSEAYIIEQITDKLPQAVQNVLNKRGISLLLTPGSVYFANPAYDVSAAIVQELNILVPGVQVKPPQGWVPREVREQQAQQQQQRAPQAAPAAGQPAPAPRPAGPQPEGR
ncbi:OmpH family outer membrane protein [Novosphingobium sp.]|uniref:OmpH family outer membrane protein n=1 Tax=Novosphingobium sp. TaxID=1874826 RepID=UPI00286AD4B0|nr:OmpH family outer membrane protein [Novosphingobium sp.]